MTAEQVLARLAALGDPARLAGMARYGIPTEHADGVTVAQLRTLARELGRDHALAAELWASGRHEARILASMVDDPAELDDAQMETWAGGFDIAEAADDDRPLVRKGVSWALRQMGKRSAGLHAQATETATALRRSDSRHARWVGTDALRELRGVSPHRCDLVASPQDALSNFSTTQSVLRT